MTKQRGPEGLTDLERDICNALDQGMTYLDAYRSVRPHSKASDKTAERYVYRIRNRPHCIAYLHQLMIESLARHHKRKDRVIEEMALVAFADIGDVMSWGPDGLTVKPFEEMAPAQRRTLSRVSVTKNANGGAVRVALHEKLSALDKLCKLFGLYESADPDPASAVSELSDIERAQRLAAILRLAPEGEA